LHALFPVQCASANGRGSLLDVEQHASGAAVGDTSFGQSLDDFVESGEDIVERSQGREFGAEDIGTADGGIDALPTLTIALVVIAELFTKLSR
jgi:hypothetical protein